MQGLIAVVGPTATGKSDLAVAIARAFKGEVISGDSRQVYRYMDIGTAKPSIEIRRSIPHHLIDVVDPDEPFSLATYSAMAKTAITDVQSRSLVPVLAGGSGLYVWSVLEGWEVPQVTPDMDFRTSMELRARQEGAEAIYREVEAVDPVSAQRIGPTNVRRLIRALELHRAGVAPEGRQKTRFAMPAYVIGLTADRDDLYRRVDERVDRMMQQGLVAETATLLDRGYGPDLTSMSGIGYKQIAAHLRGALGLAEAVAQVKYETHRLVRMQNNWFRATDARIHWYALGHDLEARAKKDIEGFLHEPGRVTNEVR